MHNAPAVSYPVGRSRYQVQILCVLAFIGLLAAGAWRTQAQTPDWRQGLMLSGAALTGLGAIWHWRHAPTGQLSWSGSSWQWGAGSRGAMQARVVVVVDLQRTMLSMLGVGGNAQKKVWMWVERDANPARRMGFRSAVYQNPRVEQDSLTSASQHGWSRA